MFNLKNILFFILLGIPALLFARDVTITVFDMDLEMPLEGAIIRSWNGKDHSCDTEGKAILSVPDDRQVTVQVSYPGYETGRLVINIRGNNFSMGLRLGGALESRELVIEAPRPSSSETKSGRSVAISGETMERSSQIGLIEDVMTSIKLLPGVGYSGMFNALPSIRGGDPGDLMSALDGFYIANPYHWGGGFSIFDPHMVASAQLSHGIFSTRYGHTISGLLKVSSKMAAVDYGELELGVSTSAVNLNASIPFNGKGGLLLMGKVTYWDPFVWSLQKLSTVWDNSRLNDINSVKTAPYIRSAAGSFNYRFNSDLEIAANTFVGFDGVGVDHSTMSERHWVEYSLRAFFTWENLQTFFTTNLSYNPNPSMLFKATAGAGFERSVADAEIGYDYLFAYETTNSIRNNPPKILYELQPEYLNMFIKATQSSINVQGRVDFDWGIGKGFIFAAGIQELYNIKTSEYGGKLYLEMKAPDNFPAVPGLAGNDFYIRRPFYGQIPEIKSRHFNTSGYILAEYANPGNRFGAELGLRVDHYYYKGDEINLNSIPVLNPRLNLDFNILKNRGIFESLDLTVGTGLFSSMNNALLSFEPENSIIDDYDLKPNRSWTSVVGLKTDFGKGWSFNIEGYFKYVYDRIYQLPLARPGEETKPVLRSDGDGIIWGLDFMIQKFESRYWDGWLSYTFTHARYHEPTEVSDDLSSLENSNLWYYPYFHRFHSANLVLNFKPSQKFNIYMRLGIASGQPKPVVGRITRYQVLVVDEKNNPVIDPSNPSGYLIIPKYKRDSEYSDNSRTTWSIPLDVKFSYKIFNPKTKVLTEMYVAAENIASLFYSPKGNSTFNQYTGTEDTDSDSANYEMPVPMVSVGIKWSY